MLKWRFGTKNRGLIMHILLHLNKHTIEILKFQNTTILLHVFLTQYFNEHYFKMTTLQVIKKFRKVFSIQFKVLLVGLTKLVGYFFKKFKFIRPKVN